MTLKNITLIGLMLLLAPVGADAADKPDFKEWLGKYGAYDALERDLASSVDQTPAIIMERAEAYLRLNEPEKASKVLQSVSSFPDASMEAERLWGLGRSARMAGRLPEAVFYFSQALSSASVEKRRAWLAGDPALETIWQDVCFLWFQEFRNLAEGAERDRIRSIFDLGVAQGKLNWPENAFWAAVDSAGDQTPLSSVQLSVRPVSSGDRLLIASALACVSVGEWESAQEIILKISDSVQSLFWSQFLDFIDTGTVPTNLAAYGEHGLLKPAVFWAGYYKALGPYERQSWSVKDPEVASWTSFRTSLLKLGPEDALKVIDRELESSLLSENTADTLRKYAFAFALMRQDSATAMEMWDKLDKSTLPLSLLLAGHLIRGGGSVGCLAQDYNLKENLELLAMLAEAAGSCSSENGNAPFWIVVDDKNKLSLALRNAPLDPLLLLVSWDNDWKKSKNVLLARRLGFLFPDTTQGMGALLYLAEMSGKHGELKNAALYLNRVDVARLDRNSKAEYLQAKAALEIDLGQERKALQTYTELLEIDPERLAPIKRLKLALLAQRTGKLKWAENVLLGLWEKKDRLDPALQAETLFWLAEGAGAMGQQNLALDRYLRLAWQYPEQNIWAVTSLYRAALVYEGKGNFEAAKKLLKTVIKSADRRRQKEAAAERLKAVEAKLEKHSESKAQGRKADMAPSYPF